MTCIVPYKGAWQEQFQALGLGLREAAGDHCSPGMKLAKELLEQRYFSSEQWHVHVRILDRFNQRYALLRRNYLRTHSMAANTYAEIKRQLVRCFPDNVEAYYDTKDPAIMAGAFEWAERMNWQKPPSDA